MAIIKTLGAILLAAAVFPFVFFSSLTPVFFVEWWERREAEKERQKQEEVEDKEAINVNDLYNEQRR